MLRIAGSSRPATTETPTDIAEDTREAKPPRQPTATLQQVTVGYMPPQMGPFECGRCLHFSGGQCDIVSGTIAPKGCCNLFEPSPAAMEVPTPPDEPAEPTEDNDVNPYLVDDDEEDSPEEVPA